MHDDDLQVSVEPMMERVAIRLEYLPDNSGNKNTELIKQHTRTERPLAAPSLYASSNYPQAKHSLPKDQVENRITII
jgi:hypothetical protein